MSYFLDSSAVGKIYHQETGSEWVRSLYRGDALLYVSELALVECMSMSARRVREGHITAKAMEAITGTLQADFELRFTALPFSSDILAKTTDLLKTAGLTTPLRSLDALQLAFFQYIESPDTTFVSADMRLLDTALGLGFKVANPASIAS